jgi:hypothetical protein
MFLKSIKNSRTIEDVFFDLIVGLDECGHQGEDVVEEIGREDDDAFEEVAEYDVALYGFGMW